jgi:hypothetical protein
MAYTEDLFLLGYSGLDTKGFTSLLFLIKNDT